MLRYSLLGDECTELDRCCVQIGSLLLSSVASTASDELSCHMVSLLTLCSLMLSESQNHLVAFHTIQYVLVMGKLLINHSIHC